MRNKIKVLLIFILIMSMFNMVYPVNAAELEEGSSHHYDMSLVQRDVVQSIISSLSIPYSLSKQSILPDLTNSQAAISWTSSEIGLISPDGQIDPGFDGMKNVTLTATVSYMGNTASKDFDVLVMGRDSSYILSYYRSGQTPQTDSMHLAYSESGEDFEALYFNTGILFPVADFSVDTLTGVMVYLRAPYLFQRADGQIGVIAERNGGSGDLGSVLLYSTEDMLKYHAVSDDEVGLLKLNNNGIKVCSPRCEYDAGEQVYRIYWENPGGEAFYNTTTDFETVSDPISCPEESLTEIRTNIPSAVPGNVLAVSADKADKLIKKLGIIENTMVNPVSVSARIGEPIGIEELGDKITANYTDTSTREFPVIWNTSDFANVDFNKKGTYTVRGTVQRTDYSELDMPGKADPTATLYNGDYYFVSTDDTGGNNKIFIRKAETIAGLWDSDAEEAAILETGDYADMNACQWAPELHVVDGTLCFFVSSSYNNAWNGVRSIVFVLEEGGNPMVKADWGIPHEFLNKNGDVLYDRKNGITLDMTYFEDGGEHYVCWAQRGTSGSEPRTSDLYIGTIDPEEPWKLTSDSIMIRRCKQSWDRDGGDGGQLGGVDEGPFPIKYGDKIMITYSGGSHTIPSGKSIGTYTVGLLTAVTGSNLLNPDSWISTDYPILPIGAVEGMSASGHHSFVKDSDGSEVFIYHTRKSGIPGVRRVKARNVHWAYDGTPILYMTPERELKTGNENVTAVINVIVLESIEVTPPDKITYNIGEPLNVTGMSVTSVYSDKSKKTLKPSDYQISGFNSEVPGVKTITITYQGKTAAFSVTVKEMPPSKYIITYKLNGGKNNNANPSSYTTETVVLKDPVRAKHIFQGWYTDSNFKTRVANVSGKNITVYAKWKKVTVGRAKISLKNKKVRKLTVNIKKVTGAKGYQISYSTSRKFKKKYTKNTIVMKNSKTLKKLKKGKIYYVKVRAYKLDSKGNKIYGKYSEVRQITIRK